MDRAVELSLARMGLITMVPVQLTSAACGWTRHSKATVHRGQDIRVRLTSYAGCPAAYVPQKVCRTYWSGLAGVA